VFTVTVLSGAGPVDQRLAAQATEKYSDSNSLTASGSRASDSGVKPAMSQKRTEQTRRSATGR
jgi:hypothetical protein